jgi:predicted nucleic acid-binding protein
MTQRFGIDTSVLVRLATGVPQIQFQRTVDKLTLLIEKQGAQIVASNQVIGESYIALQHHYGVEKLDARVALAGVLQSGLVEALRGQSTLDALAATKGCGLMDRLIAAAYNEEGSRIRPTAPRSPTKYTVSGCTLSCL